MDNNLSRIMLSLAALDLNEADLRQLVIELRSMSWVEINAQVSSLRQHAKRQQSDKDKNRTSTKKSTTHSHGTSIGERVERLLKFEAGLTTTQAVGELSLRLDHLNIIDLEDIPQPLSKKSLRDWVNRLVKKVPEKDILRCATIIRNQYVRSPISDWTLRGFLK